MMLHTAMRRRIAHDDGDDVAIIKPSFTRYVPTSRQFDGIGMYCVMVMMTIDVDILEKQIEISLSSGNADGRRWALDMLMEMTGEETYTMDLGSNLGAVILLHLIEILDDLIDDVNVVVPNVLEPFVVQSRLEFVDRYSKTRNQHSAISQIIITQHPSTPIPVISPAIKRNLSQISLHSSDLVEPSTLAGDGDVIRKLKRIDSTAVNMSTFGKTDIEIYDLVQFPTVSSINNCGFPRGMFENNSTDRNVKVIRSRMFY